MALMRGGRDRKSDSGRNSAKEVRAAAGLPAWRRARASVERKERLLGSAAARWMRGSRGVERPRMRWR
jgi:hypothetical protein